MVTLFPHGVVNGFESIFPDVWSRTWDSALWPEHRFARFYRKESREPGAEAQRYMAALGNPRPGNREARLDLAPSSEAFGEKRVWIVQ